MVTTSYLWLPLVTPSLIHQQIEINNELHLQKHTHSFFSYDLQDKHIIHETNNFLKGGR